MAGERLKAVLMQLGDPRVREEPAGLGSARARLRSCPRGLPVHRRRVGVLCEQPAPDQGHG